MSRQASRATTAEQGRYPVAEERRAHRRASVLWAALVHHDGRRSGCVVLDVSARGARLRCDEGVSTDRDFHALELPRLGALSCDVVWRNGRRLGLSFRDGAAGVVSRLGEALPQFGARA